MSRTNCLYHIIICTKNRNKTIPEYHKRELYAYIYGIIEMKNCKLIRLNGVENHIHMLVELNPSIALSKFVQDIKRASSLWLSRSPNFPNFDGWCHEYCAFTKSESDKDMIINYIKNQEHHHLIMTFDDEIAGLVTDENLDWNPRYMM